jgi:prevent-host-death family protein
MEKAVSAAEVNRKFSQLLRTVREGQSYIMTCHGKAVAKIMPVQKNGGVTRGARAALVIKTAVSARGEDRTLEPGRALRG